LFRWGWGGEAQWLPDLELATVGDLIEVDQFLEGDPVGARNGGEGLALDHRVQRARAGRHFRGGNGHRGRGRRCLGCRGCRHRCRSGRDGNDWCGRGCDASLQCVHRIRESSDLAREQPDLGRLLLDSLSEITAAGRGRFLGMGAARGKRGDCRGAQPQVGADQPLHRLSILTTAADQCKYGARVPYFPDFPDLAAAPEGG